MSIRLEYRNNYNHDTITLYTFLKDIIKVDGLLCAHLNINNKNYDGKYETHIPVGRQLDMYYNESHR